jgi:hypothetical protein
MKNLITIFIVVILIMSCRVELKYDWQIPESITTIEEALEHVNTYAYISSFEYFTPEELYNRGYGNCGSVTLMLQYLFESQLGMNAILVAGHFNGGPLNHAWVESGGEIYDATSGSKVSKEQKYMYVGAYKYTYPGSVRMVQMYGGFLANPEYAY